MIIAVCQLINYIFHYFRRLLGLADKTLCCIKVILCCTSCCLYCLEGCVKYVSKNAYIQIALSTKPFFPSAFNAFTLMLKNASQFTISGSIGRIYMFFGALFISTGTCFISYILLTEIKSLDITSPLPALLVMMIISLVISNQFLSCFAFSTDAILQAFLLDEELKFEGTNRPFEIEEYKKSLMYRNQRLIRCLTCCCTCCSCGLL